MNLILCPTDFSKNSTDAINYAAELAANISGRVIVLYIIDKDKAKAEKKLRVYCDKLQRNFIGVTLEPMVKVGSPVEKIINVAGKLCVDLIVMGSTGNGMLKRLLIGSTTAKVIQDSHCPVISIPSDATYKGIKRIVFATDLHEDNISAATMLTVFARKFDAEILFVFVDDKHQLHGEKQINSMSEKIRRRVKYPKISGYISKNTSVTKGIEYFLKKNKADLLVLFTHDHGRSESMFNTSMTKIMSHQSKIPMLSLKSIDKPLLAPC